MIYCVRSKKKKRGLTKRRIISAKQLKVTNSFLQKETKRTKKGRKSGSLKALRSLRFLLFKFLPPMPTLAVEKKKVSPGRNGRPAPELIFGDLWEYDPAPES